MTNAKQGLALNTQLPDPIKLLIKMWMFVRSFIQMQKSEGKTLQEIVEMWKDECGKEQDKSTIKLEKNRSWQEKYAEEFTAEHQASNPFLKLTPMPSNQIHKNIRGYNRNNRCQSQNTFYKVQYSRNSRQNIKQSVAADQTHKTNTHAQGNRDFRHVNRKWRTRQHITTLGKLQQK
ncbi:hypothetical protein ScPMuIL_009528 [Solemya velum]